MLRTVFLLLLFLVNNVISQTPVIKIDQLGYLPGTQKIAVLSNPISGYNSSDAYTPSATLSIINVSSGVSVLNVAPSIWNGGATHIISGDQVWWLDFSAVNIPGDYYIRDAANNISSDTFTITAEVYEDLHQLAFKSFYYQRCGVLKATPHCLPGYIDGSCHIGNLQDLNCRSVLTPNDPSSELDLSGGWHDAGDYNKYVNFLWATMIDLLMAIEYNPQAWSDDMDIPESGNYIPDLLDEIKVSTDWLLKMQQASGAVLSIVGVQNNGAGSPPSADGNQRLYGPVTTSASFTAASIFAFAAVQFEKINCSEAQSYSATLEQAAIDAYNWAVANPGITYYNAGQLGAGEQEVDSYGTDMRQLSAAIYLFAQTGTASYKNYVEANYDDSHMHQWQFVYPFENAIQQSLLYFAHLNNVTVSVAQDIINVFRNSVDLSGDNYPAHVNELDAYRAFITEANHVWGSNSIKVSMGNIYQSYRHYNLDPAKNTAMQNITLDYLHYIHGCNPNALCYLTNMNTYGTERSVNTIYHGWFDDGSALWDEVGVSTYGPAPGFLPGGPNPNWSLDDCCPSGCGSTQNNSFCLDLTPPGNQPALKSYRDWNNGWPQNSWSVTENAIYYQAAYLNLLSGQVDRSIDHISANDLTIIDQSNLYLSESASGIVFHSSDNSSFILKVNNSGVLETSAYSNTNLEVVELKNSYLHISGNTKGVVLRSPNGNHWKIVVGSDGKLLSASVSAPTAENVEQERGDLSIVDVEKGLILNNEDGDCFLLKVNDAGKVICLEMNCL